MSAHFGACWCGAYPPRTRLSSLNVRPLLVLIVAFGLLPHRRQVVMGSSPCPRRRAGFPSTFHMAPACGCVRPRAISAVICRSSMCMQLIRITSLRQQVRPSSPLLLVMWARHRPRSPWPGKVVRGSGRSGIEAIIMTEQETSCLKRALSLYKVGLDSHNNKQTLRYSDCHFGP